MSKTTTNAKILDSFSPRKKWFENSVVSPSKDSISKPNNHNQ